MIYTLDASSHTVASGQPAPLWNAGTPGTRLRIQNQSQQPLSVLITKPDASILTIVLPGYGDFVDETWVDPSLAVSVQGAFEGASFLAVRLT